MNMYTVEFNCTDKYRYIVESTLEKIAGHEVDHGTDFITHDFNVDFPSRKEAINFRNKAKKLLGNKCKSMVLNLDTI